MPVIEVVRVDNRLVHGQITTRWCTAMDIDLIIVVNDEVAINKIQQGLFDMSVPESIHARYWSVEKAIDKISTIPEHKRLLLIVDSIQDLRRLYEAGLMIPYVNIGNLTMSPGKRHITPTIALSSDEIEWLHSLKEAGTQVEIRRIPSENATYLF